MAAREVVPRLETPCEPRKETRTRLPVLIHRVRSLVGASESRAAEALWKMEASFGKESGEVVSLPFRDRLEKMRQLVVYELNFAR